MHILQKGLRKVRPHPCRQGQGGAKAHDLVLKRWRGADARGRLGQRKSWNTRTPPHLHRSIILTELQEELHRLLGSQSLKERPALVESFSAREKHLWRRCSPSAPWWACGAPRRAQVGLRLPGLCPRVNRSSGSR